MLRFWLNRLPNDYTVKDFINKLRDWTEKEIVDVVVWKRVLGATRDTSPTFTFSERQSVLKGSLFLENPPDSSSSGITQDVHGTAIQGTYMK